jgi:hypothetical protein
MLLLQSRCSHVFQKCRDHLQISRCRKGDMKQFPCWGPRIVDWHVKLTVAWQFLLGACQPVHILVRKGWWRGWLLKILGITAENSGDQVWGNFAHLLQFIIIIFMACYLGCLQSWKVKVHRDYCLTATLCYRLTDWLNAVCQLNRVLL